MGKWKDSPEQFQLDFTSRGNDARRILQTALKEIPGSKLEHWDFLWWVFNVETNEAGLKKTAQEVADNLWCTTRSVMRYVWFLVDHQMIKVTEHRTYTGCQQANEYRIDWAGVKGQYSKAISRSGQQMTDRQSVTHPRQIVIPPRQSVTHPRQIVTHTKETLSLDYLYSNSGPVPDAEPSPRMVTKDSERPRMVDLDQVPELAEAVERRIAPLPPNSLVYGIFAKLEFDHLSKPHSIVEWVQRQLSVASPVVGNSEADLLLVLAAAKFSREIPHTEVRKNRTALFISTIVRKEWRKVLRHVPFARKQLDELAKIGGSYWLESHDATASTEAPPDAEQTVTEVL